MRNQKYVESFFTFILCGIISGIKDSWDPETPHTYISDIIINNTYKDTRFSRGHDAVLFEL